MASLLIWLPVFSQAGPDLVRPEVQEAAQKALEVAKMRNFKSQEQTGSLIDEWSQYMRGFIPDFMVTVSLPRDSSEVFYQEVDTEPVMLRGAYFGDEVSRLVGST